MGSRHTIPAPQGAKTIIALHGAGMNAGAWDLLRLHLPLEALSFPGHGGTSGPFLSSISEMATWVSTQLTGRTKESVVLVGHSMGALVAMEAASQPALAGLVLIGAASRMPVNADLLAQAKVTPDTAAGLILKWGVAKNNAVASAAVQACMEPAALFNDLSACDAYPGPGAISRPALVLTGAEDKMTKAADGESLAQKLGARLVTVGGAGHMLMVEKPSEIAREIRSFVDGLGD